jgi:hypothetical protein
MEVKVWTFSYLEGKKVQDKAMLRNNGVEFEGGGTGIKFPHARKAIHIKFLFTLYKGGKGAS